MREKRSREARKLTQTVEYARNLELCAAPRDRKNGWSKSDIWRVAKRLGWSFTKAKRHLYGGIKKPDLDDYFHAERVARSLRALKEAHEKHEAHIARLTAALRVRDEEFYRPQIDALERNGR